MTDVDAEFEEWLRMLQMRAPQDAASLLATQPPERIEQVLKALPQALALRIAAALPGATEPEIEVPGSVRDLLEPVREPLRPGTTVAEAIARLRADAAPHEIAYLYVSGDAGELVGLVVPRDLLLAEPGTPVQAIMLRDPFRLSPDLSLGEAVQAAVRRHYPVYPVCDAQGQLIGQVRGWRLFEQQALELTAQSGRMVGVDGEERLDTGLWQAFRMRHPWLQLNLLTAFVAGSVVGFFEDTISRIVLLATFLPVLAGQSGNNGCQALAITLRGYTLGDIAQFPLRRLMLKELLLGGLNGLFTGVVAGAAMWWSAAHDHHPQAPMLALVILLAMIGGCMISGLLGVLVPLLLKRFGADPVTASAIFLTTGTDIAGMGLMLMLASALVL